MSSLRAILSTSALPTTSETSDAITSPTGSSAFSPGETSAAGSGRAEEEGKPKRKRKVQGKVAIIACLECRRTRARCDGEAPSTCGRCRARGHRCLYLPHTKIQKDVILNDLEQERARVESLSQRNQDLSTILEVISSDGHLEEIVQRLRRKEEAKTIASWLSSLPEVQALLCRKSLDSLDTEEVVESLTVIYSVESLDQNNEQQRVRWTDVTTNISFIDHLVKLYLACIHPNAMLFNEAAWVRSYRTGDGAACNKALLNAMCAMACNILDRRHMNGEQDAANVARVHDAFLLEARSSITLTDSQDITTTQAMAVMFMADLSSGKARSAGSYLKCASENLKGLEIETELTPDFYLSRWGLHSLDVISCANSYINPFSPQTINNVVLFDSSRELLEELALGNEMLLNKSPEQSSLAIEVAAVSARLSHVVHEMNKLYSGSNGRITPEAILLLYQKSTRFFESMPDHIRMARGRELGVDIRSLHLQYHSMVTALWLPIVSFSQDNSIRDMHTVARRYMLDSSRKGAELVHEGLLDQSCEFVLPHHVFSVVSICDSLARWTRDANEQLRALQTLFQFLDSNLLNFKLGGLLKKLVRTECESFLEPEVLEDLKKQYELHHPCTMEEALDATTRLTHVIPPRSITRWLDAEFRTEWPKAWASAGASSLTSARTSAATGMHSLRIKDLCN